MFISTITYLVSLWQRLILLERIVLSVVMFACTLVIIVVVIKIKDVGKSLAGSRQYRGPEITARWARYKRAHYVPNGFRLMLENIGKVAAVNISALPIEWKIPLHLIPPPSIIESMQRNLEGEGFTGNVAEHLPTVHCIRFDSMDKLIPGDGEQELNYRPEDGGSSDIYEAIKDLRMDEFEFTLNFSETSGGPLRTWHSHYRLKLTRFGTEPDINSILIGFGEVMDDGKCSRCSVE